MPRVLVVEDNRDFREALDEWLKLLGYQVVTTGSGREALAWLRQGDEAPDAMLVDLVMPDMDGLALLESLRQPPTIDVPAILMTGLGGITWARNLDVPVVVKPQLDELVTLLEGQCRRGARPSTRTASLSPAA